MDGASKGNPGLPGGGGIFRDRYGNWIKAIAGNFGWCASVEAEASALLKGLHIAREARYTNVEINMDSQIIVKKIQQPCQRHQPLYFTIKECQELISKRG